MRGLSQIDRDAAFIDKDVLPGVTHMLRSQMEFVVLPVLESRDANGFE
ncbi:MAG: hypothetical protein ACM3SQ_02055 [Betaproteobacteria bacterium]